MTKGAFIWLVLFAFISCEQDDLSQISELPIGTYKGQFIRTNPQIKFAPSNVTLTFTADRFYGESDVNKYPAICNGTYILNSREIEFTNECIWTADFDWGSILSGKFQFTRNGDQLELIKYSGEDAYLYKLVLQ